MYVIAHGSGHDLIASRQGCWEHESDCTLASRWLCRELCTLNDIRSGNRLEMFFSEKVHVVFRKTLPTWRPSAAMIRSAETVAPSASEISVFATSTDSTFIPEFTLTPLSSATCINWACNWGCRNISKLVHTTRLVKDSTRYANTEVARFASSASSFSNKVMRT